MEFFDVIQTARAMRRYKPDPIPEDVLVQLIEAAHLGPSGSNRQARHWVVVRDPQVKQQLADLNRRGVSRYLENNRNAANPHVDQGRRERFLADVEHQMNHLHEVPAIVIACADTVVTPADTFAVGARRGHRGLGRGAKPAAYRSCARRWLGAHDARVHRRSAR